MKAFVRGILAVGLLASASVAQAGDPISFMLANETSQTLVSLYISDVGTNSWEEDIFGDGVLPAGNEVQVDIADGLDGCEYDVKAVFSGGGSLLLGAVDFCEVDGETITVSED